MDTARALRRKAILITKDGQTRTIIAGQDPFYVKPKRRAWNEGRKMTQEHIDKCFAGKLKAQQDLVPAAT